MSSFITPFGTETISNPTAAFNALDIFNPKPIPADDGAKKLLDAALAKLNTIVLQAHAASDDATKQIGSLVINAYQGNGQALLDSQKLLLRLFVTNRIIQLAPSYAGQLNTWLANHSEPPTVPQPQGELALYLPGVTF
jgi:hypothetical protein